MDAAGSCGKAVATLACVVCAWLAPGVGVGAGGAAGAADAEPAVALDASLQAAPRYRLDPRRSGVTFRVDNFWHAHLTMRFTRMRAELASADDDLVASRVDVTIDAASLGANVPFVAALVKGSAMLDVARYPEIRFVGTRFVRTGAATGLLTGDLTIRATTRPITLAVAFDAGPRDANPHDAGQRDAVRRDISPRDAVQRDADPRDASLRDANLRDASRAAHTLAFVADGHFSRTAFGLSRWLPAVGDDVRMRIQAEFVRERADP
ncbi:YceI family protein [Burkholderia oklahomensis]|uniref:YceI-like domain protein n=1 Tax=Burkholderia oklahomensis TaxID=342113 RepID=A0AAI8BAV0_9BURK|nr:YceI family protein [Burkholderia oklahomensis]AIO68867.1 yceI-like domain protein [Burkholderia oklahomensis]AOI39392.1 hypothetical protein WG70_07000 [Burkholderia oklahomensis EO147]KUY53700.1 hypothetical protein WG70_13550 [Burkholderia oklahomensis EO147]QPS40258.1 YceI family protein [Burkholderia oklahomensis]